MIVLAQFTSTEALILAVPVALLVVTLGLSVVVTRRGRARNRLGIRGDDEDLRELEDEHDEMRVRGLPGWLGRAGYRHQSATMLFIIAMLAAIAIGIFVAIVTSGLNVFADLAYALEEIPGNFAGLFAPLLEITPWLLLIFIVLMPILHVRSRRRRIVDAVERELPIVLELLATLAEAGLGFDAAISRLVATEKGSGVVGSEFKLFQRETLSGVPRVRCLRRMAERLDVATFSTFVSSLVQAERSGFGLGEVLRHQAEDLRNRRRETALMKAQALPVKLVFPLVLCFLPGLFVLTLGPAFYTFFQLTDAVTRTLE